MTPLMYVHHHMHEYVEGYKHFLLEILNSNISAHPLNIYVYMSISDSFSEKYFLELLK